jgi:hypothetical protein
MEARATAKMKSLLKQQKVKLAKTSLHPGLDRVGLSANPLQVVEQVLVVAKYLSLV